MHALSLAAVALSAVCAALGVAVRSSLAAAVPIGVLLHWVVDAAGDYLFLASQLAATNKALEEINNLLLWYDSLSLLQRKARHVKHKVVQTVEGHTLAMCSARTACSSDLPKDKEEEEDE